MDAVLGSRGRRSPATILAVFAALLVGLSAADAAALGALEFPTVEESTTGLRGILSDTFPLLRTLAIRRSVFVEVSDVELYGVPGLRTPGARAGFRWDHVTLVGEAAQLSSDVGRETLLSITAAAVSSDRWAASVGVNHESAAVDKLAPARLISLTARSRVRFSNQFSIGAEIRRLRLGGEAYGGADASLMMSVHPTANAAVFLSAEIDRWIGLQPSVSARLTGFDTLRLLFGYEAVTDALKGAIAIERAGLGLAVGASYHPVLGIRQGITLSWRR